MVMEGNTDAQESCFKLKAAGAEVGVPQPESGSVPGAKPPIGRGHLPEGRAGHESRLWE